MTDKELKQVRDFGKVFSVFFAVLSIVSLYKESQNTVYFLIAATFFWAAAIFCPKVLRPLERTWMWFGMKMSVVVTFILLFLTFVFAVIPMSFILKLLRKDLLATKLHKDAPTYWIKRDLESEPRHFLPY